MNAPTFFTRNTQHTEETWMNSKNCQIKNRDYGQWNLGNSNWQYNQNSSKISTSTDYKCNVIILLPVKMNSCKTRYYVISGFLSSIVRYFKNTTFRKRDLFPSSGKKKGGNAPTQLRPLERANLNHWTTVVKVKLYYDRQSVGQSVLVSSTCLGLTTRFLLLSDSCVYVNMGRSLWRENGSTVYSCWWSSPAQSYLGPSLVTMLYCLRFETPPTWRARSPY
jgi:hypothetical protein